MLRIFLIIILAFSLVSCSESENKEQQENKEQIKKEVKTEAKLF